jgi:ribonuclease HII
MTLPDLARERALWQQGVLRVAGVDEVGRGCLSGPVLAVAAVLPAACEPLPGVRDSKTLGAAQRDRLYCQIKRQVAAFAVGAASVEEIDRLNILNATYLAMQRALRRLGPYDYALIDGRPGPALLLGPHTAIVDGDSLCYSIACASILAKVIRDRLMTRLAARYPGYGWERNAGYGTRAHLQALARLGVTPLHRRSFAPVRRLLPPASS